MDIKESQRNDITLVSLTGRLDSSTSAQFEQYILTKVSGQPRLIIDFSDLDYISSAGLRVLLLTAKKVKQGNGRLILCALKAHIREVFEISGFLSILDIRPSEADALDGMAA